MLLHMEDTFFIGAKALIFNQNNQLLLLNKKSRNPSWDLPGGRIQKNESLQEALKREVCEETGIQNLKAVKFLGLYLSPLRIHKQDSSTGLIFALHLCHVKDAISITLSSEHDFFSWENIGSAIEYLKSSFPTPIIEQLINLHT